MQTFQQRYCSGTFFLRNWYLWKRIYSLDNSLNNFDDLGNHQITWNAAIEKHVDDLMFRYSKLNTMLLDSQVFVFFFHSLVLMDGQY